MFKQIVRPWLNPLIITISLAILFMDSQTIRGTADYIFYFLPVAISVLYIRPAAPFLVAFFVTILSAIGYFLSPANENLGANLASLNRSFAVVTLWMVAILVRQIIVTRNKVERSVWLRNGASKLAENIRGELTSQEVAEEILANVSKFLDSKVGALFIKEENAPYLKFKSGNAWTPTDEKTRIALGDGLLGQAAKDKKSIKVTHLSETHLKLKSALGESLPQSLLIIPLIADGDLVGVLELGLKESQLELAEEFLSMVSEASAIALRSAQHKAKLSKLLQQSQAQSEELQAQQEELRVSNEELEQQTKALKESHVKLENQQAELEQSNQQLEEQTQILENQKLQLDERNLALVSAQRNLEIKARELARSSQYKSEFLANMSHELRTPLNSTLILSKLLSDNKPGNLNPDQIKYADIIYNSGTDLLNLINDILDLSKVEAGKMVITPEIVQVKQVIKNLQLPFEAMALQKNLAFHVEMEENLPQMVTDRMRLEQIMKNLLSNALKFTKVGTVTLSVKKSSQGISFSVTDTGTGITSEQQQVIFEAFTQADGTTNRKFGGTGLGLSISKELARILGGSISVDSRIDHGSTFTLHLPITFEPQKAHEDKVEINSAHIIPPQEPVSVPKKKIEELPLLQFSFADDRDTISQYKRKMLIVEDDEPFAKILYDLAREMNFGVLVASTAGEGLTLARKIVPQAIILDVRLPDHSGLVVLDQLKLDAKTRHIPVHVISSEDLSRSAMEMGAIGYLLKPVKRDQLTEAFRNLSAVLDQKVKQVLVVEDDEIQRDHIVSLIQDPSVRIDAVSNSMDALEKLSKTTYDCMIMDLALPDLSGHELLAKLSNENSTYSYPPVIVYTARDITREEEEKLRLYSGSIIIKGAKSPERLLSEVTLFLHRVETELPVERQKMLKDLRSRESTLSSRKILIVDDDVRNIFALTSSLEVQGAQIVVARNGREALEKLKEVENVDLVLMDIMMPEMDGYEAMQRIRTNKKLENLPIIALTAKAMKDDRQRCLDAGANDYLSKPLDIEKLLSLIRVWLPQKRSFIN